VTPDLLQLGAGLRQRRRRLFVRKTEVAAYGAQLTTAGSGCVCVDTEVVDGKESALARHQAAGGLRCRDKRDSYCLVSASGRSPRGS